VQRLDQMTAIAVGIVRQREGIHESLKGLPGLRQLFDEPLTLALFTRGCLRHITYPLVNR